MFLEHSNPDLYRHADGDGCLSNLVVVSIVPFSHGPMIIKQYYNYYVSLVELWFQEVMDL